jgi:hypothetical protein
MGIKSEKLIFFDFKERLKAQIFVILSQKVFSVIFPVLMNSGFLSDIILES